MTNARKPAPEAAASVSRSLDAPPTVSIGLPVYNGERFLEESLTSLIDQTYEDFELIISDNASTDGTEQICRAFALKDSRVKYFRNEVNKGSAANWNRTFELASGPYFKWAAHDDVCGVKFLELCVDVLKSDPSFALCYPGGIQIDENSKVSGGPIVNPDLSSSQPVERFAELMSDPFWATSLFGVVRRDVLARTNLLGNYMANDHILLAEIALRGRFALADEVAFFHRHYIEREQHQKSAKSRAKYASSTGAGGGWPRIKLIGGYLKAIRESDVSPADKMRCGAIVGRWLLDRTKARLLSEDAEA
jgi:glycosyltransferase involved in cell wall biosynthesis